MHRLGVQHGSLMYRHFTIVEDEDEDIPSPYVVSLARATTGHDCKCSMTGETLWGIPEPAKKEVGCDEIYAACKLLGVFAPSKSLIVLLDHLN